MTLPTDVIRATRPAKIVTWTGTRTTGRDGLKNIEPGYFETAADATSVLEVKGELIGTNRRRFLIEAEGEVAVDPETEVPSFRIVDSELQADLPALLTRYEYDMETERTSLEVLG